MKIIFSICFLFATLSYAEDCYSSFLLLDSSPSHDSNHYSYSIDAVGISELNPVSAISTLHYLVKDLSCKPPLKLYNSVDCKVFFENNSVCFVSTDMGFFYIMFDYVNSVNIIFNRWD